MSGTDSDSSDTISTTTPCLEKKKSRRRRTIISRNELKTLEAAFADDPWPSRLRKGQLAIELSKSELFISTWFQNKRARIRKSEESDLHKPCNVSKDDHIKTVSVEDKDGRKYLKIIRVSPSKAFGGDVARNRFVNNPVNPAKIWWPQLAQAQGVVMEATPKIDEKSQVRETAPKSEPEDMGGPETEDGKQSLLDPMAGDNGLSLLESIIRMIAMGEGGIMSQADPAFNETINDYLYGINVNGNTRIVYDPQDGVKMVSHE